MKKFIAVLLVVALTATLSVAGTLAYLTDRDSEANVFTVGDVAIDLNESFGQGATLIPGVTIEKKPTITNTGKNDAWVWATIAIPSALDNDDASKNVVHFNFSKESVADGLWAWTRDGKYMIEKITKDGVEYNVYTVLYQTALKNGEETAEPVMTQVYMDHHVDIDPNGDWYHVEGGVATGPYWNSTTNGNPVIYVSAYAMQTEGFADVFAAYDAYKAQWADNGYEWGAPVEVKTVSDKNSLKDALSQAAAAGETTVVIDAEGSNMGDLNYGLNTATVPAGTTVTIKNAVFSGRSYGNAVDGTVVFDNCTFTNTGAYSIHFDAGSGNVVFNNCTLEGWCSFGAAITGVELNNCTISGNGTYGMVRFFQNTTLTNCVIDCGNANHTDNFSDGISAVNGSVVELVNCTVKYADYEVSENGKITADGVTVLESVDGSSQVLKAQ